MPRHAATARDGAVAARPVLRTPECVGREAELCRLADALSRPPAVVLIEGEAGIGKSRLLQELLAARSSERQSALVAGCPPFRDPYTLAPVVDAIRQATDRVDALPLSGLAGALRPLFPEWSQDLPPSPEPAEDATAARHRLFRALVELLECLHVGLLAVEDVHWADEATVEFLLFLVARRPQPVSIVVTYRPEDVPADSLLLRLSSRLAAGVAQVRLALDPLDVGQTAQLMSSMLAGEHVSDEFAALVYQSTEGIPLAVEESVRLMGDRADVTLHDGAWVRRHLTEIAVPPTIRDAVLERIQRLSSDAQVVVQSTAVLTEAADEPTVFAVSALAPERARSALVEALASRMLQIADRGQVAFRHVLACRAVHDAVPAPERLAMHLRAGRALEGQSPPPVARLTRHFRAAHEIGEWCRYAEQTADLASAAGDDTTAAMLINDLLTGADLPPRARARLGRKLATVAVRRRSAAGDLVWQIVRTLRAAAEDPELTDQEQAAIRSPLGHLLLQLGEFEQARAEFERAIPGLDQDPAEAAKAMNNLGHPRGGPWPANMHLEWLQRCAELTTRHPVPPVDRLALDVDRATYLLLLGEEAGWALAAELPHHGSSTPARRQVTLGYANTGYAAMLWGRYPDARHRFGIAMERAQAEGDQRVRHAILASCAHLDWLTGDWAGLAGRAAALIDSDEADPGDQFEGMIVAGLLKAATGDRHGATERLSYVLDRVRNGGLFDNALEPAAALARIHLAEGHTEDALKMTEEPMRIVVDKGIWIWATEIAPARVDALIAGGDIKAAADLVTGFGRGIRGRNAPAALAALALCRAIVTQGRGQDVAAAAGFTRAAAAWQELPRPYDALLSRERRAQCLLAARQIEAALVELGEVFRGLSELGAQGDAARVAHTLRQHGVDVRGTALGRPSYGDQLSPRELDVVRLLASGQTNREIADSLFLSPKTVASHVHSAMRKLRVSTRTALAVSAVELGVVGDSVRPIRP